MADVLFKRGLQKDLPPTAQDGVFYLTTDTHRLYIGQGTDKQLLNQTINIVPNLKALTDLSESWTTDADKAAHVEDFYYITALNVLAVWTDNYDKLANTYGWQLINKDSNTKITSSTFNSAVSSDVGIIYHQLTDSDEGSLTATLGLEVSNGLKIYAATATNGLLLSGNQYAVERSTTGSQATITLTSSQLPSVTSGVVLEAGNNNVHFASTGTNSILISTDNTKVTAATLGLSTTNPGDVVLTITDSDENDTVATLQDVGIILNDSSFVKLGSTVSKTGGAIYSKAEIDNLINGLNGMTYVGTIGKSELSPSVLTLPTTGVKNGDTYVVVSNGITTSTQNSVNGTPTNIIGTPAIGTIPASGTRVGDMFIAKGIEGSNGEISGAIEWTYIPAGDESLDAVTYSATATAATNTILLQNSLENAVMKMSVNATTGVTVSSTSVNGYDLEVTVGHDTYSTTYTTATNSSKTSFTAISGVTVDNGHVTGYELKTFTPIGYSFGPNASSTTAPIIVSTSNSATNAVIGVNLQDNDETPLSTALLSVSSDTIKFSEGSTTGSLVMNIEWGSF